MKQINRIEELHQLLKSEDQIILFFLHSWSGQSVLARKTVEAWETQRNREVHFVDVSEGGENNLFHNWLVKQEIDDWVKEGVMIIPRFTPKNRLHGHGEICWISHQKVIGFESIDQSFNPESLEVRTSELFG